MIRLDATTRKLQAVLGGAVTTNQLPIAVMYSDKTTTNYLGAAQLTNTNNTTVVDICDVPAAGTVRDVDYISVRNNDTATATITIRYNDNGTTYNLVSVALVPGYSLVYTHGNGWEVFEALSAITAADVANVPAGNIAATNVQTALNELDSEKAKLAGDSAQDFSIETASVYDVLVLPKTSGKGIKVDTSAPTFPWASINASIHDDASGGATRPAFATYRNNIKQFQFAVNDEMWAEFEIPSDYAPGTDLYLHAHWSHNSAAVASGSVTGDFELTYSKGHDQAAFPATVTLTATQTASTTQYRHMTLSGQISTSGGSATQLDTNVIEPHGMILCRVVLTANTMSAATDPFLHGLSLVYQSTGIGTKNREPNFYT